MNQRSLNRLQNALFNFYHDKHMLKNKEPDFTWRMLLIGTDTAWGATYAKWNG